MGVLGLWQLLSPVGQPVTLESLENKIFAVDISIWLNQALKGYRDSQGGSVPNAHLLSLFSRLCKLLFYKIKPIIVFDGGFPELKKQTIINRQQRRAAIKQNTRDFGLKILTNYLAVQQLEKTSNISSVKKISFKSKSKPNEEIFKLPPLPECSQNILSDLCESNEDFERKFTNFSREDIKYLNQIDIESDDFNSLPPDVKQEILSTLKESRKHRTWDQFEELPKESNDFSNYQMQCLLKKRKLQSKLEEVQKDIRKINSSAYVSQYTNDHVIGETNKIMSDDTSYYVLLKKIMNPKESNDNNNSAENIKPSTSSMADTKSAFIKDVENIDLEEDYFSDESTLHRKEEQNNKAALKIKSEVFSLDLSEEEYDIDNPPLSDPTKEIHVETLDQISELEDKTIISKDLTQDDVMKNQEICINYKESVDYNSENETGYENPDNILNFNTNTVQQKRSLEEKTSSIGNRTIEIVSKTEKNTLINDVSVSTNLQNNFTKRSKAKENDTSETEYSSPITINHIPEIENESNTENKTVEENSTFEDPLKIISSDVYIQPSCSESPSSLVITNKDILKANCELQKNLTTTAEILESEQAKQDRQSSTVQDHMIEECKELLSLFGIPYVISPLEAEAQCAFYDIIDFTHGTITDDSDVFLFGGKRVFKNFFTQQKFVECYKDKEIFSHFGFSRKKLINFALLSGSDYTEGIEGVGPVTAMEIISEFPGEGIDALQKFKDWWQDATEHDRPPENKVRTKLRKLVLSQSFPDMNVFEAYLNPEVDSSMEKFTWGRPDLDALRDYAKERFGWNQSKVDTALLPVLKKLNERDKQTHLDSFFTVSLRKETNLFPSKRIMSALKKITSPQKQGTEKSLEKNAIKRKSKTSDKKTNCKKVIRKVSPPVKGRDKKRTAISSQGPLLSEESSSDS